MPTFQYRYVPYGTRFQRTAGQRASSDQSPEHLFDNEIVVDVGGSCWGYRGEDRSILDHHFFRNRGQFPSAAAAVLHSAERIHRRFSSERQAAVSSTWWLVSHQRPDFDAYAAMYLARAVISGDVPHSGWIDYGLHPDGWLPPQKSTAAIDWFEPQVAGLTPERRWPILLAAHAACVDNCRPLACAKNRTLHSLLYAALIRGRDYLHTGAVEFFEEVRQRLNSDSRQLNPLYDAVLEGSTAFAPELDLLDRELEAYRRDVLRARRAIVYVQRAADDFHTWFPAVQQRPLMAGKHDIDPCHLYPSHGCQQQQMFQQVDGIYLRDPQCLLFKEWARTDTDHSSMGAGFQFTAVAFSRGRSDALVNHSDYYFALDPERAGNAHLYNVWTRLQCCELEALAQPEHQALRDQLQQVEQKAREARHSRCREGFEGRAGDEDRAYFDDPWFDGHNYNCTLIATPNRGSLLSPGIRHDLTDDPVAQIVQAELEYAVFAADFQCRDYAVSAIAQDKPLVSYPVHQSATRLQPAEIGYYRFGGIALRPDVQIAQGNMAEQIGRILWQQLEPESGNVVPVDFAERHLLQHPHWVAVWSRCGVAVAYRAAAQASADSMQEAFRNLAALSRDVAAYAERRAETNLEPLISTGEELLRRVTDLNHQLSLPENRPLHRFFQAMRMADVLNSVHSIHTAVMERSQRTITTELEKQQTQLATVTGENIDVIRGIQNKVEWLEIIIVLVYLVELLHIIHATFHFTSHGPSFWTPLVILLCAIGGGGVAAFLLQPWKHAHGSNRQKWLLLGLLLAVPLAYFVGYTVHHWDEFESGVQQPVQTTAGEHEQVRAEEAEAEGASREGH